VTPHIQISSLTQPPTGKVATCYLGQLLLPMFEQTTQIYWGTAVPRDITSTDSSSLRLGLTLGATSPVLLNADPLMLPQDLTSGRGGLLSHHTGSVVQAANRRLAVASS